MSVQDLLNTILDKVNYEEDVYSQVLSDFSKEQLPYKLIVHIVHNSNGSMTSTGITTWDATNDVAVQRKVDLKKSCLLVTCYAAHI